MPPEVTDSLLGDALRWAARKPAKRAIYIVLAALAVVTSIITLHS